ncbi:MAG: shikimate dehydrogenase [Candidatus Hydrogenedentes bacterium]|nr:shikimate dehydrogenase [Candidatus Hydrogenedentota bacterium]
MPDGMPMHPIDAHTQLCAIIGRPVAHSLSPALHNAAFQSERRNIVYLAFEVEEVGAFLSGMRSMPGFLGLSVTIPHKIAVMEHLDEIEPLAQQVGSVNTILNRDGRLFGYTTDGLGALRALDEAGVSLSGKRVLMLGSGGAARAVAFAIAQKNEIAGLTILGRTRANVETLAENIAESSSATPATGEIEADLEGAMLEHDIVIQGTPVGMEGVGEGQSCIPARYLRAEQTIFDMVYRPLKTQLIRDAESAGCATILGTEMLLYQAALQYEIWTETRAPVAIMREALLSRI